MCRSFYPAVKEIRRFGFIDVLIIALIATTAVAFVPVTRAGGSAIVSVRCGDRVIARYPLNYCADFRVHGAEGPLDIYMSGKGASVVHSTCRNRICVHTGQVCLPGQRIICAPNRVVIEVISSHSDDLPDAVAR